MNDAILHPIVRGDMLRRATLRARMDAVRTALIVVGYIVIYAAIAIILVATIGAM